MVVDRAGRQEQLVRDVATRQSLTREKRYFVLPIAQGLETPRASERRRDDRAREQPADRG